MISRGVRPCHEWQTHSQQWIGQIPKHWEVKKLKYLITECVGGIWGDEPKNNEMDIICIRVADIDNKAFGFKSYNLTTRNIKLSEQKSRLLKQGNLVIEKSGGGDLSPVGRVAIYNLPFAAVCSNFMAKLTVSSQIDSVFLYYFFQVLYGNKVNVLAIKATTGIQNIDISFYLQNLAPVPPLSEQKEIVAEIERQASCIEQQISQAEQEVKLLEEYKQALIHELITGQRLINP